MLNFMIGGFIALVFLGLPLAIIALFLAGSLEKRPIAESESNRNATDLAPVLDRLAEQRRYNRRRIVYGGRFVTATKLLNPQGAR
jgi:hypothetical protein